MPWSHSLHPASSVWNSLLLFTASLWILLRCCSLLQSVACTIANDGVLILLRTLPKSQCLHLPEKTNTLRNHHHRMQNCWVSGHRYSTIFLFSFAYLKSELVAIQCKLWHLWLNSNIFKLITTLGLKPAWSACVQRAVVPGKAKLTGEIRVIRITFEPLEVDSFAFWTLNSSELFWTLLNFWRCCIMKL